MNGRCQKLTFWKMMSILCRACYQDQWPELYSLWLLFKHSVFVVLTEEQRSVVKTLAIYIIYIYILFVMLMVEWVWKTLYLFHISYPHSIPMLILHPIYSWLLLDLHQTPSLVYSFCFISFLLHMILSSSLSLYSPYSLILYNLTLKLYRLADSLATFETIEFAYNINIWSFEQDICQPFHEVKPQLWNREFYITYLSYKNISQKTFWLAGTITRITNQLKIRLEKTFKFSVEGAPYQAFGSTVEEVDTILFATTFPTYRWNAHSYRKWLPVGHDSYEYIYTAKKFSFI